MVDSPITGGASFGVGGVSQTRFVGAQMYAQLPRMPDVLNDWRCSSEEGRSADTLQDERCTPETGLEGCLMYRVGELFCGPGGMAIGAFQAAKSESVDLVHSWATDYDADTCATYARNIPGASSSSVFHSDIRELNIRALGDIDGLAFGFPCNDFSSIGEKLGFKGEFGPLYQYGVDVLRSKSPQWFVAENVGGLRSSHDGEAFKKILSDFIDAGYDVVPHLYKFEEYGVPQRRHRILIVGVRRDLEVQFRVPAPTTGDAPVSARAALETPPIATDAANHEMPKLTPRVVERLSYIKAGENAWTANIPDHLKLNVSGATLSQIYRKLDPDAPSYTVTGSGGGGTYVYHWDDNRALTNRERARLQTFPDSFRFVGKMDSVRKQVGMAVPPKGAEVVFTALFRALSGRAYESIDSNLTRFLPATLVA